MSGLEKKSIISNSFLFGENKDPHSVLGIRLIGGSIVIKVWDPLAKEVYIRSGGLRRKMKAASEDGLFSLEFKGRNKPFDYLVEKHFADGGSFTSADPYRFLPGIGDVDIYLFNGGEHHRIYDVMGAHFRKLDGVEGVLFAVWAPNARRVSVVGDFNCWDGRRHPMRMMGSSGIWELFIPGLRPGDLYKFEILTSEGAIVTKLDPYARRTELRPNNAGVVTPDEKFVWSDSAWMKQREKADILHSPVSIYEVHLGSWGGPGLHKLPDGREFYNYRELAEALADYVASSGFTHVELLPVCEHPLDQSWGYQVTGMFAPTARYGSPGDFAYFVDTLHARGIGVLLDWVPAHFPKDAFSLGRFDGTALYEYADPRQGEHKDWGTYIFNFGRYEVKNFLIGSALYWLDKFHIDGLRVDAVASMLYLDYSRTPGEWIPNKYGGHENLEAIEFIRRLNQLTHELFPGTIMVAEESTSWPGVSRPTHLGGLGFTFKWNMGWMHDALEYFALDPVFRSYHHNKLTFSLYYAFSENFILPLSHDEVVHGKKSLLDKMPGDYERKFANLRALFCLMFTHPGKKLLFMGAEIAQFIEWNSNKTLDWQLLDYPKHAAMLKFTSALNKFYRASRALWEIDFSPAGFIWLDGGDSRQSIVSYIRLGHDPDDQLVVILNLTPVVRDDYTTGVPLDGVWEEVFNSDASEYGGTGLLNSAPMTALKGFWHGQRFNITLRLPWLSGIILKRRKPSLNPGKTEK